MSRHRERTPTDIEVTYLDFSEVDEFLTKAYREKDADNATATVEVKAADVSALVDTPAGAFVFGTEGVGAGPLADDEKWELWGYASWAKDDSGTARFSMVPVLGVEVSVAELREYATDKRINLAAFIRTFGDRLESNYEDLRREITKAREGAA